jgi:hypothetical protein
MVELLTTAIVTVSSSLLFGHWRPLRFSLATRAVPPTRSAYAVERQPVSSHQQSAADPIHR